MSRLRQNINIELADGSKQQLEEVRCRNGMTQKEIVGRLINWFCDQDEVIQQIILGQIPKQIAPDVAQIVLKRLADADHAKDESQEDGMLDEAPAIKITAAASQLRSPMAL